MSKVIHVTTEIAEIKIGGIATVCDLLYENREDEEFILVVKKKGNNLKEHKNLTVYTMEEFKQALPSLKYDKIIFHNYLIAHAYLECNLDMENAYYVMHSNILFERMFECTDLTYGNEQHFIDVISNFKIIFISNYEIEMLNKTIKMLGLNINYNPNYSVIYNGISGININESIEIKNNNKYGYIGRLDERKGILDLCREFTSIPSQLLIATGGKGNYAKTIFEDFAKIVNSTNNIIPVGYCQNDRKKSFFNSIDALIIPSLYEPFGMIVLEAIKYGVPIISNKTGGIVEILGEDYPFYFDMNVKNDIKNVLCKFQNTSDEDKLSLIQKLKERCLKHFSADVMTRNYRNV